MEILGKILPFRDNRDKHLGKTLAFAIVRSGQEFQEKRYHV